MFCPKCGIKNPDDGKFCRSCGVDLANVSAAMSGKPTAFFSDLGMDCGTESDNTARRHNNPAEVYGDSIKSIISGIGFFAVSMALLFTGVANGRTWWWAMLFPAFMFLAKGISDLLKSRKMESSRASFVSAERNTLGQPATVHSLPSTQADYLSPDPRYKTGDLVPPSVTDGTTRHLEMDSEGKTMTLPKQ